MSSTTRGKHFNLTIDASGADVTAARPSFFGTTSLTAPTASPMAPVSEELANFRNSLGWIDSVIIHRQTKKEAQKAVSNAYLQLIEAQGQLLLAKITLGLDAAKKSLLVDSLRRSGEFDREIQALSAEFVTMMFDGVLDASIGAAEAETRRLTQIEAAYAAGRITADRYQTMRELASEATDHANDIVKDTATRIIKVHLGKLEITLESFKQRAIAGNA